jgi:hypothetical protein
MTRLLLCTATILALTASANAQASLTQCWGHDACVGQNLGGPPIPGYTCAYTVAKGECRAPQPVRVQRSKQPRR